MNPARWRGVRPEEKCITLEEIFISILKRYEKRILGKFPFNSRILNIQKDIPYCNFEVEFFIKNNKLSDQPTKF